MFRAQNPTQVPKKKEKQKKADLIPEMPPSYTEELSDDDDVIGNEDEPMVGKGKSVTWNGAIEAKRGNNRTIAKKEKKKKKN